MGSQVAFRVSCRQVAFGVSCTHCYKARTKGNTTHLKWRMLWRQAWKQPGHSELGARVAHGCGVPGVKGPQRAGQPPGCPSTPGPLPLQETLLPTPAVLAKESVQASLVTTQLPFIHVCAETNSSRRLQQRTCSIHTSGANLREVSQASGQVAS